MGKPKPRAAKDIMIYGVGSILRQLVGFIMLPIYTSYLTPADYGIVSLLVLSMAISELLIGARFAQVIPRFYYDKSNEISRQRVLSTALTVTALISFFGVIVIWLSSNFLSSILFGSEQYSNYIGIYSLLLFTSGIESYGLMYLRILEKPLLFIIVSLVKLVIQLSLNIYLIVFLEYGVMGVIMSGIISSSIFCVLFLFMIYVRCGMWFDRLMIKQLVLFSWPLWLSGFAGIYIHSSNRFFIRIFSSLDDVGLFELATKFSSILGVLVWYPFSNWWQVQRFKILKESSNVKKEYQQIFDVMSTVMAVTVAGIILFSEPLITIMSSSEFHRSTSVIFPLTLSVYFSNLTLFFNVSFLAKNKTTIIATLQYLSAVVITILFILLIPEQGIMGASLAILVTSVLLFLVTYFRGKQYLDLGIKLHYVGILTFVTFSLGILDTYLLFDKYLLFDLLLIKSALLVVYLAVVGLLFFNNKPTLNIMKRTINKIKIRFA